MLNAFQQLATENTGVIGLLASLAVVEFAVIVYQWKYTKDNTIPKELFYSQEKKFEDLHKTTNDGFKVLSESLIIIKERLGK